MPTTLEYLDINQSSIDVDLSTEFATLKNLKKLILRNDYAEDQEGLDNLRKQLPDCVIRFERDENSGN